MLMGCTLKDSKKTVWKFHTAFNFVLRRNKQGTCISQVPTQNRQDCLFHL